MVRIALQGRSVAQTMEAIGEAAYYHLTRRNAWLTPVSPILPTELVGGRDRQLKPERPQRRGDTTALGRTTGGVTCPAAKLSNTAFLQSEGKG
jgi:hypothetical protein